MVTMAWAFAFVFVGYVWFRLLRTATQSAAMVIDPKDQLTDRA